MRRWTMRSMLSKPVASRPPHLPRVLPATEVIEEETTPGYKPNSFLPIKIGDLLVDRFEVISKLGYGSYSTVWLTRDRKS